MAGDVTGAVEYVLTIESHQAVWGSVRFANLTGDSEFNLFTIARKVSNETVCAKIIILANIHVRNIIQFQFSIFNPKLFISNCRS